MQVVESGEFVFAKFVATELVSAHISITDDTIKFAPGTSHAELAKIPIILNKNDELILTIKRVPEKSKAKLIRVGEHVT